MMRTQFDRDRMHDEDEVVADYMAELAGATPARLSSLPDPNVLWAKAQMLRRWDAERRAQAPLDMMEPIQIVGGLAAAAVLFVWSFPSLFQVLFTSM